MIALDDLLHNMRRSAGDEWLLDNIRQPEVFVLHQPIDSTDRQAADADDSADYSQASGGAGGSHRLRASRIRLTGTGEGQADVFAAGGGQKNMTNQPPAHVIRAQAAMKVIA